MNGGSDVSGYSYHFHTGAIASLTRSLGSSFATAFDLQFYDEQSNTVKELRFNPELLSETFQPAAVPTLSPWGSVIFTALLIGSMLLILRQRKQSV